MPAAYTDAELEFLKGKFAVQFGEAPRIADGLVLRMWKSGPHKGRPRVPAALQGLLERDLMRIASPNGTVPVARFTSAGLLAFRETIRAARNDAQFAHLVDELRALCREVEHGG